MKKFAFIAAAAIALFGAWSCDPNENENENEGTADGITLSGEATLSVPSEDVEIQTILFKSTVDWKANADVDWVTISPTSGKAGDASVKVTVDDNPEGDARTAKVTIEAGKESAVVSIVQDGAFIPYFDVDPSDIQFSGFDEGEPYVVEKESGEYIIPVSTNLEWDIYLAIWDDSIGDVVETMDNGWLSIEKRNNGIKVTVTENTTYDSRVEYIYAGCHVGDNYDDYGGFGACILFVQGGLAAPTTPTLVWRKNYSELDEAIESTVCTRLAYSEGEIMLSDGAKVYGLDPASGDLWDIFDVAAASFDSDDAGNLVIMPDVPAEYDDDGKVIGPTAMQILVTPSIYDEPVAIHTMDYTEQAWGTIGNFRARGDVLGGKGTIMASVGSSRFYYGWAFNEGEYVPNDKLEPIRSSLNATGDGSTPDQIAVISVSPEVLTEGIIYRGYVLGQTATGDDKVYNQSTFLRVDPTVAHWSGPEWRFITDAGNGGNECQNNIDILDFDGKRLMAFTQGAHFNWGPYNAKIYVFDITNLSDVKAVSVIEQEEWIENLTPAGLYIRGADILLRDGGDHVELYAVHANFRTVAKYVFSIE
mgnify:FL=1